MRCPGGLLGFIPICPPKGPAVTLGLDHLEAIRLHDIEGLDQESAAERMKISRATMGRILREAHKIVGYALVEQRKLIITANEPVDLECENNFLDENIRIAGHRRRRGNR